MLRTIRSPWWTLLGAVAACVGSLSLAVETRERTPAANPGQAAQGPAAPGGAFRASAVRVDR